MKVGAGYFRSLRLEQDFVVDVGVYQGTPWLYDAFSSVPFVLVEPFPVPLTSRPSRLLAEYAVAAGAGQERGAYRGQRASRQVVPDASGDIEVLPLEEILAPHSGRFGLKVNAEGADAEVIEGLGDRRGDVAWLHVELPLRSDLFRRGSAAEVFEAIGHDFLPLRFFECPWPHGHYCFALFLPACDRRLKIHRERA